MRNSLTAFVEPGGFWCEGFFNPSFAEVARSLVCLGWSRHKRITIVRGEEVLGRMTLAEIIDGGPGEDTVAWWSERPAMRETGDGL